MINMLTKVLACRECILEGLINVRVAFFRQRRKPIYSFRN